MAIYGLAGFGIAAFSPSALSLVADVAAPGKIGRAYAWYALAHYGAIGVGPFVGGVVADWSGSRRAFVGSAVGIVIALAVGLAVSLPSAVPASQPSGASCGDIRRPPSIWAGWIASVSGLLIQGVVFTFFPLLAP